MEQIDAVVGTARAQDAGARDRASEGRQRLDAAENGFDSARVWNVSARSAHFEPCAPQLANALP